MCIYGTCVTSVCMLCICVSASAPGMLVQECSKAVELQRCPLLKLPRALELIGYKWIITSTSQSLPLKAWLQYDGSFVHFVLQSPPSVGTNAIQSCDMNVWLLLILSEILNDGHVPIVGLRTTSPTIALACPFMTACNTLSHLITEHPELQYIQDCESV